MARPDDDNEHGLGDVGALVQRAHEVEERHESHGWMEKTWSFAKGSAYAIVALNPITLPATLMLDPRFRRIELAAARSVTIAPGLMLDASIGVGNNLLASVVPILRDLAKWAGGGALVGGAIGAVGGLGVLDEATIPGGLLAGFEAGLMIGGFWALKDLLMEAAKHLHTFINYSVDAAELAWYAGNDPTVSEEQDINAAAKLFAIAISELWWVILQALILWVMKRTVELGLKAGGAAIEGTAFETALSEASEKSAKFGKPFTDWFKTNFREIQAAVESRTRKLKQIQEGDASGGGNSSVSTPAANSGGGSAQSQPSAPPKTKVYSDGSVRTADGKFAGKTGTIPGTPGVVQAEAIVNARPGWRVVGKEISVRDADGTLRRYDLVAENPQSEYVGIEVKSGTASRTAQQRAVDANLNQAGGFDTVGQRAQDAGVDRISSTEEIKVP